MTVHISKATRIVPRLTAVQLGWETLEPRTFSSGILHEEASRAVSAHVLHP